ncbi:glycosyl hydrolase [Variovorax sp. J22P271]|uniref:glycosyl hydrolase n=1 Tax=Variovorax davisae TaxID=3053515 RepID=UPI002578F6FC|nr:glycosyl hydrolase [Variovorax sp. J22P271]MDM0032477.1 glycosyl hydrolase [Variovorax sp. J22P271]
MNLHAFEERRRLLGAAFASLAAASLAACGGGGGGGGGAAVIKGSDTAGNGAGGVAPASSPVAGEPAATPLPGVSPGRRKSTKRGVAYDLATERNMVPLTPGVIWWYDWSLRPNTGAPSDHATRFGMDFVPMLWGDFDEAQALAYPTNERSNSVSVSSIDPASSSLAQGVHFCNRSESLEPRP